MGVVGLGFGLRLLFNDVERYHTHRQQQNTLPQNRIINPQIICYCVTKSFSMEFGVLIWSVFGEHENIRAHSEQQKNSVLSTQIGIY